MGAIYKHNKAKLKRTPWEDGMEGLAFKIETRVGIFNIPVGENREAPLSFASSFELANALLNLGTGDISSPLSFYTEISTTPSTNIPIGLNTTYPLALFPIMP